MGLHLVRCTEEQHVHLMFQSLVVLQRYRLPPPSFWSVAHIIICIVLLLFSVIVTKAVWLLCNQKTILNNCVMFFVFSVKLLLLAMFSCGKRKHGVVWESLNCMNTRIILHTESALMFSHSINEMSPGLSLTMLLNLFTYILPYRLITYNAALQVVRRVPWTLTWPDAARMKA